MSNMPQSSGYHNTSKMVTQPTAIAVMHNQIRHGAHGPPFERTPLQTLARVISQPYPAEQSPDE
jgi:hypothetical protein